MSSFCEGGPWPGRQTVVGHDHVRNGATRISVSLIKDDRGRVCSYRGLTGIAAAFKTRQVEAIFPQNVALTRKL